MTTAKYKIRIINETILDLASVNEAKQVADIIESRQSVSNFLGNLTYTYSEIEKVDCNG